MIVCGLLVIELVGESMEVVFFLGVVRLVGLVFLDIINVIIELMDLKIVCEE